MSAPTGCEDRRAWYESTWTLDWQYYSIASDTAAAQCSLLKVLLHS